MIQKHMWKPVSYSNGSTVKPSPRWGHSSCVIGDQLVLFGGYADSIYMNDVWVYHTCLMQWTQIKTFGTLPSHRSNSSLHYDKLNNQIVMFGGGGSNKTRFNSIHLLDWTTKVWTQVVTKQSQQCPWQRTYHSSQLLYPYLIVYGGQGVADLDDLWVYNLQSKKWTEVPIQKNSIKPCGRRFHSSCLIGNQFYVIAGCYSKYRPLSDVFSIDLTNLVKNQCFQGLKWREIQIKNASFLTRWGHASASLNNKIYIFGGRFSNDLNDILVLQTDTLKIKTLKASPQSLPKARRRACINFVGNCLLMFGGFNTDYFNDLHFINVTDGLNRPKKYVKNLEQTLRLINNKQTSDLVIKTISGENIYCHKGILMQNFESEPQLEKFLQKISGHQSIQSLLQILDSLYKGYGGFSSLRLHEYDIDLPKNYQQKQALLIKSLQKIKDFSLKQNSLNIFSRASIIRIVNNNIIELSDEQFENYLEKNRQSTYTDVELVINQQYVLKSNQGLLRTSSKFFKSIFSKKYSESQGNNKRIIKLDLPNRNVVLMEILLNFLLNNLIIVPENMSSQSWFQLYELADYFSLNQLKEIVVYHIWCKLDEKNVDNILEFSVKQNIEELAICCARLKIKNMYIQPSLMKNKYVQAAFSHNRFEIKQKILNKQLPLKKKMSSMSTEEGQKENYETCNQ